MRFACESCGRSYAVADELRGRAFKMKCKACGHLIVVKGTPAEAPPATHQDENPFVVTPVSAAAVAAAAEAFRAAPPAAAPQAEPETRRIPEEAPAQGGYIDLVLDDNAPAGPAAQAGSASPAPAAASPEGPSPKTVRPPPLPRRTGGSQPPRGERGPAGPPPAPARLRFDAARRAVSGRKAIVAGGVAVAAFVALAVLATRTREGRGKDGPAAPARPAEAAAPSPPVPSPAPGEAAKPAAVPPVPDRAAEAQPARRRASESRPKRERPPTVAKEERAESAPEQPAAAPAGSGPEAAPAPAGVTAAGGPPSSEEIGRIVTAHRQDFESCISEAVRRDPGLDLGGRQVLLTLTVNPAGTVDAPRLDDADLDQSELGACLKRSARRMAFPAYQGSPMQVEVPLSLGRGG